MMSLDQNSIEQEKINGQTKSKRLLIDDVKCPICLYILTEPVTMPCKHSTCKACFMSVLNQTALQCPVCRGRVGSFSRLAMKSGKLINQELWAIVQEQFKEELHMQQLSMSAKAATETLSVDPAAPGEIREEFEKQVLLLHESNKAKEILEQEEQDKRIAAALHDALNSGAARTRRQAAKETADHEPQQLAPEMKKDDLRNLSQKEGYCTPQNGLTAPFSGQESDSDEGDWSDEELKTADKCSARRLFQTLTPTTSEMLRNKLNRRPRKRKISPGKEGGKGASKKRHSAGTKRFPGCNRRPRIAGTANLSVSNLESEDDQHITEPFNDTSKDVNNSPVEKVSSSDREDGNDLKLTKSGDAAASSCNSGSNNLSPSSSKPLENNVAGVQRNNGKSRYSKKAGFRRTKEDPQAQNKSDNVAFHGASELPEAVASSGAAPSGVGPLDLSDDALSLVDLPANSAERATFMELQRELEARLKQEAEDAKLARRLQRHLATTSVDRTQGSGEEYQLRPRRSYAPRASAREAREAREASPCF